MRKDMHHNFGPAFEGNKASVRCNGYYITQRTEPRYRIASDKQDDVSSLVTSACLARVRRYGYLLYHTTGLAPSAELWIRKETYHHVAPGLEVAPCAQ